MATAPGATLVGSTRSRVRPAVLVVFAMAGLFACACAKIGPDYTEPQTSVNADWRDAGQPSLRTAEHPPEQWWLVFDDPVLAQLVELARQGNPTLELAAVRVLESRARRGIAVGGLYPQVQDAIGSYSRVELSGNRANRGSPTLDKNYDDWEFGGQTAWELDLWGRLRRGVEAADAELLRWANPEDDGVEGVRLSHEEVVDL